MIENKLTSRKFWVWVSSFAIVIASIWITKSIIPEVINMYGLISAIYIGGNTASAWVKSKEK